MTVQWRDIDYHDGSTLLSARFAWDDAVAEPRPGVLVSHAWRGRSEFENTKAEELAELGYCAFALDLYGKGIVGRNPEENKALMQPFIDDRALLQQRMQLALAQMQKQPEVDPDRAAAIGFCFGGLCVLDLARSGADLAGVVSFHGLLGAPAGTTQVPFRARVLVLHGWDDPMAPPTDVLELAAELSDRAVDWQLHAYGRTMHAFTNRAANDAAAGLQYDARSDARSGQSMRNFLAELFS